MGTLNKKCTKCNNGIRIVGKNSIGDSTTSDWYLAGIFIAMAVLSLVYLFIF